MKPVFSPVRDEAAPQVYGGKYRTVRHLGSGGMAEVFEVVDITGRHVALKVMRGEFGHDPALRIRFLQERVLAATIKHPGAVSYLDEGVHEGRPFLVMELLDGETAQRAVERAEGPLPLATAIALLREVLSLLSAAHRAGVLHRDLKPENVFMLKAGGVKVLDFGIGKMRPSHGDAAVPSSGRAVTVMGHTMGTPGYMAPEQARGLWNEVDERSDLWSLAATAHHLVSGKCPHDDESESKILVSTLSKPAPSLATLAPSLPASFVAWVDRGLSFNKRDRFASADEMLAALEEVEAGLTRPKRDTPMQPSTHVTQVPEMLSPVEIARDTFWVGKRDPESIFHANPYLRIYRPIKGGEAREGMYSLLIDPGSSSDFAVVSAKVGSLLGNISKLSAVFINHQDPDVGSSANVLVSRYAPRAAVLCSEATWRLIMHTNLPRDRFIETERYPHGFRLPTGHVAVPVPSPFCHFRGAVMLYDPETRVLFSGDLFGGLTAAGAKGIWADESDWSGIRAFHQAYMPCNRAIARTIARIRQITPAVEIIAPQHGRVLRGELMHKIMARLETLPVGLDVMEEEDSPDMLVAWNSVLHRVLATARLLVPPGFEERMLADEALRDTIVKKDSRLEITSLGRWTLGAVVGFLSTGQAPQVGNALKLEAISAAEDLSLPAPDLHIDDGDGVAAEEGIIGGMLR